MNFFDSADTYGFGHNETLIGQFIKQGGAARRAQVVLATKFGIVREAGKYERRIDNSPAYVASACEASLRRLDVDCIDLYYCHRRNPDVPIAELVGAMADLVKAGKVRQIGLSEVSAATLRRQVGCTPSLRCKASIPCGHPSPKKTCLRPAPNWAAAEVLELDGLFTPERVSGNRYQEAGMLGIE